MISFSIANDGRYRISIEQFNILKQKVYRKEIGDIRCSFKTEIFDAVKMASLQSPRSVIVVDRGRLSITNRH